MISGDNLKKRIDKIFKTDYYGFNRKKINALKELCVIWMFQRAGGRCEPVRKNEGSLTPEQSSRTFSKELRKPRYHGSRYVGI